LSEQKKMQKNDYNVSREREAAIFRLLSRAEMTQTCKWCTIIIDSETFKLTTVVGIVLNFICFERDILRF
jgi:glycerol-3-phosphate cytidylyltransferase-like family protein